MQQNDDEREDALPVVSLAESGFPEIADYEFLSTLGQGGMSSVFKARQRTMDRIVAVKVLHSVHDLAALRRFESEVKLTFAIDHRNIIKILSYGVSTDERAYLVLEYLEGESLAQRLSRGPLLLDEFRVVFISLLLALIELHKANIIHRDVKPANIFLCTNSETEMVVKLLDMGIAQDQGTSGDVTIDGGLVGSPAYMSPEQCAGAEVDGRSDLYSLALVMYESITGKPLFHGESALDTMLKQANTSAPTTLSLCKRAGIPADLARCLLKCLTKSPQERYPSAAALLVDLQKYLQNAVEFSPSKPGNCKSARWTKIVAITLFAGVVCSALAFAVSARVRPQEQPFPKQTDPDALFVQSVGLSRAGDYVKSIALIEQALKNSSGDRSKRALLFCNLSRDYARAAEKAMGKGPAEIYQGYFMKSAAAARSCIELCAKMAEIDVGLLEVAINSSLESAFILGGKSAFLEKLALLEQVPRFQSGQGLEGLLQGASQSACLFIPYEPKSMQLARRFLEQQERVYGKHSGQALIALINLNRLYCRIGNRKESDKLTAQLQRDLNNPELLILNTMRRDYVVLLSSGYSDVGQHSKADEIVREHLRCFEDDYQNDNPMILVDLYKVHADSFADRKDWKQACLFYEKAAKRVDDRDLPLKQSIMRSLEHCRKLVGLESASAVGKGN